MPQHAKPWSDLSDEPLTLEAIRRIHVPAQRYRISGFKYPPETHFAGAAIAGRAYVLAGICRITRGPWSAELKHGEYADFPGGSYRLVVPEGEAVELVWAWELPAPFSSAAPAP